MANKIFFPRTINYKGKGLIAKNTIDSEIIVVDKEGQKVESIEHNDQEYIPCIIGDTIIVTYTKKKISRKFKVVGIDVSEQFYVCEIVLSFEDNIELQLIEIQQLYEKNSITSSTVHQKADDLLVQLLYEKGYNRIADAYLKVTKFYD